MGIPGSANLMLLGGEAQAYEIEQSLRFDEGSSTYLTFTPSSAGNRKTWTISFWLKKSFIMPGTTSASHNMYILEQDQSSTPYAALYYQQPEDYLEFFNYPGGASYNITKLSENRWRDPAAWIHYVIKCDTTAATAADRTRVYANGAEIVYRTDTNISQNTDTGWNKATAMRIGGTATVSGRDFNGYLAEFYHVDGTALDPTSFGEFDDNGVWRPIKANISSYGTNGFYLKFDPTATNGIGHDHSGNGNNFTATGFTTNSTFPDGDVVYDTPTKNFPVINPIDPVGGTHTNFSLIEGNLAANRTGGGGGYTCATFYIPANTPKFYVELKNRYTTGSQVGVVLGLDGDDDVSGGTPQSGFFNNTRRLIYRWNGATTQVPDPPGNTLGANSIVQLAVDLPNGKLWVGVNNTWYQDANTTGGDPSAGTGASDTTLDTTRAYKLRIGSASSTGYANGFWANFGQQDFNYTPPTGFEALSTALLAAPDIADGSDNFQTVLYTGNGSSQSITGIEFQPDLVWVKKRSSTSSHWLTDAVRGSNLILSSNSAGAELSGANQCITAFNSNGFSVGNDTAFNQNTQTYVAWAWDANGAGSSNTAGSITSTVSANPSAGFSIVSYTGNGTSGATVGHGLGVAPSLVIVKLRETATDGGNKDWAVYHSNVDTSSPQNYVLSLSSTSGRSTSTGSWNNTAPSSTVFTVGNSFTVNNNGKNHIAYCFAEVEGYSKFGSYTGNGSSDGPFVYCGFKPAFVMIKVTDQATTSWMMRDDKRDTDNPNSAYLLPNSALAEYTNLDFDFLSNGFKPRHTNGVENVSGKNYIFAAFASSPFGGSGVSPATAR